MITDREDKVARVYTRFLEIIEFLDKKYVSTLEEVLLEEAEILSKNELSDVDRVKLLGIKIIKEYIANEMFRNHYSAKQINQEDSKTYNYMSNAIVSVTQ